MLRFNFELNIDNFDDYMSNFNLYEGVNVVFYLNKKTVGYKYLYTITLDNNKNSCVFTIGLGLNCLKDNDNKGFIEFNPNNCYQLTSFIDFFNEFRSMCYSLTLVRYDLAIDIGLPRNRVKLLRDYRCNYEYEIIDSGGSVLNRSVTEYQGRRNHNKFTKLYDKTKESHLDYNLTRIEFTFNRDEVLFQNLPRFVVYDDISFPDVDFSRYSCNDLVLVDLLRNSPESCYYLKSLSYRKRRKIKLLIGDYDLKIDFNLVLKLRNFALSYEC